MMLASVAEVDAVDTVFDPRRFGAQPDGKTLCTQAIQKTIDACTAAGGGTVWLTGGTFLSGTLRLKDNVTLHIETGAMLLGSRELLDYPSILPDRRSYTDNYTDKSLIYAEKTQNIAIVGRGIIDGQGGAFPHPPRENKDEFFAQKTRPYLLRIVDCTNVLLRDLTIRNSPMWCLHFMGCDSLIVESVMIRSRGVNGNNDGIDIDGCRNVRIANCDIDSGDDAICFKSTSDRDCENVVVANCVLSSGQTAIKTGTESTGGFKDILVSNCTIRDSGRGIALSVFDGGILERVSLEMITMRGVRVGIAIELFDRGQTFKPGMSRPGVGAMRDISLRSIQGVDVSEVACLVRGLPDQPIRNVAFDAVRLRGAAKATRTSRYTPRQPVRALFDCSNVEGLRLRDIDLDFQGKNAEEVGLLCDRVNDLWISAFRVCREPTRLPLIHFSQVQDALIRDCQAGKGTAAFLRVDGAEARDIVLSGNDLKHAQATFERGEQVQPHAVEVLENRIR